MLRFTVPLDRSIHITAIILISLSLWAKLISIILIQDLHYTLVFFEILTTLIYFTYLGWLGLKQELRLMEVRNYIIVTSTLFAADLVIDFIYHGWDNLS